jgi:hypothetical protein
MLRITVVPQLSYTVQRESQINSNSRDSQVNSLYDTENNRLILYMKDKPNNNLKSLVMMSINERDKWLRSLWCSNNLYSS